MSAAAKTPAAPCARYWNKEAKAARKVTRRERRRQDRAALRAILTGADADAAIFAADLGTQGRLTH